MKYLKVILTVIAVLLLSATLHLINLKALLTIQNQNYQLVVSSNQAIMTSNQHLEDSLSELTKRIEAFNDGLLKDNR